MNAQEIATQLSALFPPERIGWKPAALAKDKSRGLAVAYIDARDVMDRLDSVVGIDGWQDEYLPGYNPGTVICLLRVHIGELWITKTDIGSESGQDDAGDRGKSAFSDALKRAAVKFGIGRYLYSLPQRWYGWDEKQREFTEQPGLPAWAMPKHETSESAKRDNPKPKESPNGGKRVLPKTGADLFQKLLKTDRLAYAEKIIRSNELLDYIRREGMGRGYSDDISKWDDPSQIEFACLEGEDFLKQKKLGLLTPAEQHEILVAYQERYGDDPAEQIEQLCNAYLAKTLAGIPAIHYQEIKRKLREIPVRPVTASTR